MRTFKDAKGREWTIDLTVGLIRRIKDAMKIDLLTVLDGQLLARLGNEPLLVFDIIWTICKTQQSIDESDFADAMRGEQLKAAADILEEELIDFFQSRGPALKAAMDRVNQAMTRAVTATVTKINGPEMDELLERELGRMFGSSPASSESTPTVLPSDSST